MNTFHSYFYTSQATGFTLLAILDIKALNGLLRGPVGLLTCLMEDKYIYKEPTDI